MAAPITDYASAIQGGVSGFFRGRGQRQSEDRQAISFENSQRQQEQQDVRYKNELADRPLRRQALELQVETAEANFDGEQVKRKLRDSLRRFESSGGRDVSGFNDVHNNDFPNGFTSNIEVIGGDGGEISYQRTLEDEEGNVFNETLTRDELLFGVSAVYDDPQKSLDYSRKLKLAELKQENDLEKIEARGKSRGSGKIKLKKLEDGLFHKIQGGVDMGPLKDESGNESAKFWEAEKEENIGARAQKLDQRRSEGLDFKKSKSIDKRTKGLRKEYDTDISTLEDMDGLIDTALVALENGGPLGDKVVKSALSKLSNSKVRALAELNEFKSYGTFAQRVSGQISQFLLGEKTNEQKQMALDIILKFRGDFVRPGLAASKKYYRELAKKGKLDLHSVVRFTDREDVRDAFKAELISEDEAVELIESLKLTGKKP